MVSFQTFLLLERPVVVNSIFFSRIRAHIPTLTPWLILYPGNQQLEFSFQQSKSHLFLYIWWEWHVEWDALVSATATTSYVHNHCVQLSILTLHVWFYSVTTPAPPNPTSTLTRGYILWGQGTSLLDDSSCSAPSVGSGSVSSCGMIELESRIWDSLPVDFFSPLSMNSCFPSSTKKLNSNNSTMGKFNHKRKAQRLQCCV